MRRNADVRFAAPLGAALLLATAVWAEPGVPVTSLSAADRAAIAAILDALNSPSGGGAKDAVFGALNGPGVDGASVVRAVKLAAGAKAPLFQSLLLGNCLGGGAKFCQFAALQAPASNGPDVQTAATAAAAGGGGGGGGDGGFSGTPQVNRRHLGAASEAGSGGRVSNPTSNFNFGSSFPVTKSVPPPFTLSGPGSLPGVPGPVDGAGLPGLAVLLAGWLCRRRAGAALGRFFGGLALRKQQVR